MRGGAQAARARANGGSGWKRLAVAGSRRIASKLLALAERGYPEAVVWQGGAHDGVVNPVAHCLTDAYALIGTLAAINVLGLPFRVGH